LDVQKPSPHKGEDIYFNRTSGQGTIQWE